MLSVQHCLAVHGHGQCLVLPGCARPCPVVSVQHCLALGPRPSGQWPGSLMGAVLTGAVIARPCNHFPAGPGWARADGASQEQEGEQRVVWCSSSSSLSSLFPSTALQQLLTERSCGSSVQPTRNTWRTLKCPGVHPLGSDPSLLTHRDPPSLLTRLWGSAQQPCCCSPCSSGLWPWAHPQPLAAPSPTRLLTGAEASGAFCVNACQVFQRMLCI